MKYRLTSLVLAFACPLLFGQVRFTYKCAQNGKYSVRYNGGVKHFCWDRVHYTESNAPAEVLAFFESTERSLSEATQNLGTRSRQTPLTRGARTNTLFASNRPEPVPVSIDALRAISAGTPKSDVIAKLGKPHGSIAGMGDSTQESWTYVLPGGTQAKIKLENAKVASVIVPE